MELLEILCEYIRCISKRKAICLATAALLFSACGHKPKDNNAIPNEPDSIKTERLHKKAIVDSIIQSYEIESQKPKKDPKIKRIYPPK